MLCDVEQRERCVFSLLVAGWQRKRTSVLDERGQCAVDVLVERCVVKVEHTLQPSRKLTRKMFPITSASLSDMGPRRQVEGYLDGLARVRGGKR